LEAKVLELAGVRPAAPASLPEESEKEFMARVVALAKRNGWLTYHTFQSRKSEAGFPDLVLCRGPRALVVELKTRTGCTTAAQDRWLEALRDAALDARVWRPRDWPEIVEVLEGRA
jgi:hypothetical protein